MFRKKMSISGILEKVKLKRRFLSSGIAVDIDGTCADTHNYWTECLCQQFGIPKDFSGYRDLVRRYGCLQNVPIWKENAAAQSWMREQIFSPEAQLKLPIVKNSNAKLFDIHIQIIPVAVYLTARPSSVFNETKAWLRKNGFPDAEIITKPSSAEDLSPAKWKADLLSRLFPEVCGIIEDDLSQIQLFPADYQGIIFLLEEEKSPRDDLRIIPCPDWRAVKDKIEQLVHSEDFPAIFDC